jgi:hypothetical protein
VVTLPTSSGSELDRQAPAGFPEDHNRPFSYRSSADSPAVRAGRNYAGSTPRRYSRVEAVVRPSVREASHSRHVCHFTPVLPRPPPSHSPFPDLEQDRRTHEDCECVRARNIAQSKSCADQGPILLPKTPGRARRELQVVNGGVRSFLLLLFSHSALDPPRVPFSL